MNKTNYTDQRNIRTFDIEVISVPIVYNKYGDHDPDGLLYVLKKDAERIKKKAYEYAQKKIPQPYEEIRPLVIRANVGDEIVVHLSTSVERKVSLHVQGLSYDVKTSDGAFVGYNPDTTTSDRITYRWYAQKEGVYYFHDMADTRSSEKGSNVHGLFGAIIIEEAGSTWFDPVTGEAIESGLFADVYHPVKKSFREYTIFFHDELEIRDKDGNIPFDPHTNLESSTTGISYRSEPMRNRDPHLVHQVEKKEEEKEENEENDHPVVIGEDISMSSWPYGDPAPEILRAYVGDPSKIRLVHGGIQETHVFHLHNHQWRLEPDNSNSTIIDSISISPGETYTLDILYGAGSKNGMIGDAIWHCHLYPHFHEGMWSLWRVFDRLEDGTGKYPDGTPIKKLMPLKDRPMPKEKDTMHPGFPGYINGEVGKSPHQPPYGILTESGANKIEPTELENANFALGYQPGALYTKTCPCATDKELKVFELALVQVNIKYNSHGWHDPQGRIFVLKEDLEKHGGLDSYIQGVKKGKIEVEPLVIRANVGDCVEIRLTNLLPEYLEESAFQLKTRTDMAGFHLHLLKFDTIVSDGGANGWNNIGGARPKETIMERFFVDDSVNTVFFHDHLSANAHQNHGVFGALIIEPTGATFHDVRTGKHLKSGTKAVIRRVDGSEFREFALFVHDFAFLFDKEGKPLNPPENPGSHDDPGVMGINYKAEPMRERLKKKEDPAFIFSSNVHGDPATPILETYPDDEIIIRLIDGAHEEQHCFNIVGMAWKKEMVDKKSPYVASQTIGLSEVFNIQINEAYNCGDYLYYFGGIDDTWLGLWGIIRVHDRLRTWLKPLCKESKRPDPIPRAPGPEAVIRKYEIAVIQKDIRYNKYGDHDPDGLLFVSVDELEDVMRGKIAPKPLILRANAGEWIEVTLRNLINPYQPVPYHGYPYVPLDKKYTPSNRVSINPQFLKYSINDSGVNVGYNQNDQTIVPGEFRTYLWYADKEYGACTLQSFGDLRNHRYHGLFGAVIIEPAGAQWTNNMESGSGDYKEQVVVSAPGMESFREYVVFIQNGIRVLDQRGKLILTASEGEDIDLERLHQELLHHHGTENPVCNSEDENHTEVEESSEKTKIIENEAGNKAGNNVGNKAGYDVENKAEYEVENKERYEVGNKERYEVGNKAEYEVENKAEYEVENKDINKTGSKKINQESKEGTEAEYFDANQYFEANIERYWKERNKHFRIHEIEDVISYVTMDEATLQKETDGEIDREDEDFWDSDENEFFVKTDEEEQEEEEEINWVDVDAEDSGEKGYNYRSERFYHRFTKSNDPSKVFSSKIHGDPSTPIFKAYSGDRVIFRVLMPADKPRNVGFAIHGHTWKEQPRDFNSRIIPLQGAISVGNVFNMELEGGAAAPGDYLYRSGSLKWDVESGMWGIFRVMKQPKKRRLKTLCRSIRKTIKKICKRS